MGHNRKESITTLNNEEFGILCPLKSAGKISEIKLSEVQTHNFDASFLKISKTRDGV